MMPIDFAAIARAFQSPLRRELGPIADSFKRLGDWLSKRADQVSERERSSREFPIIRFYNEALMASIDHSQHESLGPEPPPSSFWQSLRASGQAFAAGLGVAGRSVEEALILPRLFGMIGDLLDMILNSLERFGEPSAAMFNPSERRASDLFGEMGLFFRAFGTSLGQIRDFAAGAQALRRSFERPVSPFERLRNLVSRGAAPPTDGGRTTAQLLDDAARWIAGAVLSLPLLPDLLTSMLGSAGIAFRVRLLDAFQGIESRLFGLRRQLIDFIYDGLMEYLGGAMSLVVALQAILMDNLRYYLRAGLLLGQAFLASFQTYIHDLSMYLRFWTDLIEAVRRGLEAFENFDLVPALLSILGVPGWLLAHVPLPSFTIGDLIDAVLDVGAAAAREVLNGILTRLEEAVHAVGFGSRLIPGVPTWDPQPTMGRIAALRKVLNLLVRAPEPLPPETRLPSLASLRFPNVFDAFFGAGAPHFDRALAGMRDRLLTDIPNILATGAAFLSGMSDTFRDAAARASMLGSPDQYRTIAENAAGLAGSIFGDQEAALRQRIAARAPDLMAETFEGWVTSGGFELIGAAIPAYVGEMQRYWQEQASVEHPTSPHILDRRRRLGRVQMPRLIIRAADRVLDAELVAEIAASFRGAIQTAYQTGLAQYQQAAAG